MNLHITTQWLNASIRPIQFCILVLMKSKEKEGTCWITQREMAEKLGVTRETIHRNIKELERKEIVKIQKSGTRNGYQILG